MATARGILVVLAVVIVLALGQFGRILADYADQLEQGSAASRSFLHSLGV